jgi:hypothetical protein
MGAAMVVTQHVLALVQHQRPAQSRSLLNFRSHLVRSADALTALEGNRAEMGGALFLPAFAGAPPATRLIRCSHSQASGAPKVVQRQEVEGADLIVVADESPTRARRCVRTRAEPGTVR